MFTGREKVRARSFTRYILYVERSANSKVRNNNVVGLERHQQRWLSLKAKQPFKGIMLNLKIIRGLNVLVSGALSGLYFINNSYYLEDIKNSLEFKIKNTSARVAPKIKNLVREVMNDMSLSSEEKSLIQIFVSNDCNLKHLGYPDKKFGAYVGVPQHFIFDKTTDFIVLPATENMGLSPDCPEIWNFKNLLTLSKEAKQFAVASEIYETKHFSFYYLGLLPCFVFLQGNIISILSEKLFKVLGWELPLFHGFLFLMAVGFYVLLHDIINTYREREASYQAAMLGSSYLDGGIEYYEKIIERNKTIKKLDKSAPFTSEGEIKKYMGFRTCSMPFKRRIMLLKDLKKKYKFSDNKQNPLKHTL